MTAMTTWSVLLDDYATLLESLEWRLEEDDWDDDIAAFAAPALPSGAPTPAELRRFAQLQRRAEHVNERMLAELEQTRQDVTGIDVRREAAREYGGH